MPQAKVLGQLLVMQSIINNLPTKESILNFVCRGFNDLPGVSKVEYNAKPPEKKSEKVKAYEIRSDHTYFGELLLEISNKKEYGQYDSYIQNFVFMLAVILEERRKSAIIETHKKELEKRVEERTSQLEEEIKQKTKIEKDLRESEANYRLLAKNALDLIAKISVDGSFLYVSPSSFNLLGYQPKELVGRSAIAFIHPDDLKELPIGENGILDLPLEGTYTYRIRHKNGQYIWFETKYNIMFSREGDKDVAEAQASSRDISIRKSQELKLDEYRVSLEKQNLEYIRINKELMDSNEQVQRMVKDLLQAKEKAEESDMLKTMFLANMNHEIRTPLNGVLGFSNLLVQENIPESKRIEFGRMVVDSANRLLTIFEDILDYSKISSGDVYIEKEDVSVKILLEELRETFQPLATEKKVNLNLVLENQGLTIFTDAKKMRQVFSNLLKNAFKYTTSGEVTIGCSTGNDDGVCFYVKDTGIGIQKGMIDSIFERFRQVEMDITRNFGGTGIGLSICKKIVELLGGDIWVESEINVGSTFYFTVDGSTSLTVYPEETEKRKMSKNKFTILVAEDEELNFRYISEVLSEEQVQLLHAYDGFEAVKLCEVEQSIDMVLMDIRMPNLDGYQATQQIKDQHPDLPIVAQTAFSMVNDKQKAMDVGCDDYLTKPIRKKDLLFIVDKYRNQKIQAQQVS